MNILGAMDDPKLLNLGPDWLAWRAFFAAKYALPMTRPMLEIYRECTGRKHRPKKPAKMTVTKAGRRSRKTFATIADACWRAATVDYKPFLAPGEWGVLPFLACDKTQARQAFDYADGLFSNNPMLARLVTRRTRSSIELATRRVRIEIRTASYRSLRGISAVSAVCDEVCFWRDSDSANPAEEIFTALKPALSTIPGATLDLISTPWSRSGAFYELFAKHWAKDDSDVLCWSAPTLTMNPNLNREIVENALAEDETAARAEWLAEWRDDVSKFLDREVIEACIIPGRVVLPPNPGVTHVAFVDPSGGRADAMTLCIAHRDEDRIVIDQLLEKRPPFNPTETVREFAEVLKAYQCHSVTGDAYGGEFCRQPFRDNGIAYEISKTVRSDLYRDFAPLLTSGLVELPDNKRLTIQLVGLERRVAKSGRESIDHSPGAHDDLANATAGAACIAKEASVPLAGPRSVGKRPSPWGRLTGTWG